MKYISLWINNFMINTKSACIVIFCSIQFYYGQCIGDANLNYRIDSDDVLLIADHLLDINPIATEGIANCDIDYNTDVNIIDLLSLTDLLFIDGSSWCEYEPVDLSLDWQYQEDTIYFDHQELQTILSNDVMSLNFIRGFMVLHRGKIVAEEYYYGSTSAQEFNIYSVTKSYIATLVGQAIEMGFIMQPSVTLDSIFYENDYTSQVRLENLLSMTSGWPENWYYMYTSNILEMLLGTPLVTNPGDVFFYNNAACHINSYVLLEKTGLNPKAFATEYLFPYLGIDNPNWGLDYDGVNNGSYDLILNLKKMVKLGQLYLQDGFSGEEQILSSNWINEATSNQIPDGGYGYLWWIPEPGEYMAIGYGGQLIVVIPELELVIGTHSLAPSTDAYFNNLVAVIYDQVVPLFDLLRSSNERYFYKDKIDRISKILDKHITNPYQQ